MPSFFPASRIVSCALIWAVLGAAPSAASPSSRRRRRLPAANPAGSGGWSRPCGRAPRAAACRGRPSRRRSAGSHRTRRSSRSPAGSPSSSGRLGLYRRRGLGPAARARPGHGVRVAPDPRCGRAHLRRPPGCGPRRVGHGDEFRCRDGLDRHGPGPRDPGLHPLQGRLLQGRAAGRPGDPAGRARWTIQAPGILGGRHGPHPVHAVELPGLRRGRQP